MHAQIQSSRLKQTVPAPSSLLAMHIPNHSPSTPKCILISTSHQPSRPPLVWTREKNPDPSHSSVLVVNLPRPGAHGKLALDGVDAVADGGEDDEEDYYYDCDGDVALDHCGGDEREV